MKFSKFNLLKEYSIFFWLILITISGLFIFNIYSTNKSQQNSKIKSSLDNIYLKKTIKEITKNLEPRYTTINYKSKPGDTYQGIINKLDITQNEKNLLLKTIQKDIK